jgi:thioredoxin-related protein
MRKVILALALVSLVAVSCKQTNEEMSKIDAPSTDSTTVKVDSVATDSTSVDTTATN